MSTVLSLPEELVVEIFLKRGPQDAPDMSEGVCRTFNVIIKDSLALQYIISLAACGMRDDLSMTLCQGTAERLQRLHEHEAAWREIAWSDGGVITHTAAYDLPTAISGSVLAFLKQYDYGPGNSEVGDRLFLLPIPSKLRGITGESWELKGLGEMSSLCIDAAQDLRLLLFHRAGNLHVRALSSGKVYPAILHSGAFDMGMGTSDVAETPVAAPIIKWTVIVWNWRAGNRVVVLRPLFAHLGRDIAFLDEMHLLTPASTADSTLRPGQNYDIMLVVHISVNTASFSPPTDSSSSSSRGYFYTDPKDRIITLEVTDNNWIQSMKEKAELYVPARTFLAYIAAHPPAAVASAFVSAESASPRSVAGASGPVVDVPWEEWGPYGARLVRTTDQTYIIRRPRACGMRVLGAPLCKKSVVVADYHPGRVARSATATVDANSVSLGAFSDSAAAAARVRARAPIPALAQLPVGVGTFSSESRSTTGTTTLCFPRLVCATKEVPLPPELQKASESPWTMLCEDAFLAFEYVPGGFKISRVFAYTF
ncbi:hypothetical protein F5888DRAFT_1867576 [Russula emetica]|nr:hypothetical protein F5888DRAFT_1867576 [Russula emetica]